MKLREYEYILTIAKERNMVRAAKALYISQPALSKLLSSVEDEVGMPLFERHGREMIPTEAGRVYLENAQQIVEMNDDFKRNMKQMTLIGPRISLSYPLLRTATLMNCAVPILRERIPTLSLYSRVLPQNGILDRLLSREHSLVFGIVTEEYARTLSYRIVASEEIVLAVPKGHTLESLARSPLEEGLPFIEARHLASEPFVMPRAGSYSERIAKQYFHANGIAPPIAVQTTSTSSVFEIVAAGVGVAIVPSIPLRHMRLEQSVTYLSIQSSDEKHAVGLMYRKDYELSPAEEMLVNVLREIYKS